MRFRLVGRGLFISLCLLGAVQLVSGQAPARQPSPPSTPRAAAYRGGLVSPPLPKPTFLLTDTSGAPFDFASKTQGAVTLLFFGYAHCPDMCPTQMSMIARALAKIPAGVADQFKVVFATTDPARDNPASLRSWLDQFDKRFIGLTGSDADVEAAQRAAGVTPARKSAARPDGTYDVGHAAFVLAYTKDNLAHVIYPVGVKQADLEHDLPLLVKEKWTRGGSLQE